MRNLILHTTLAFKSGNPYVKEYYRPTFTVPRVYQFPQVSPGIITYLFFGAIKMPNGFETCPKSKRKTLKEVSPEESKGE